VFCCFRLLLGIRFPLLLRLVAVAARVVSRVLLEILLRVVPRVSLIALGFAFRIAQVFVSPSRAVVVRLVIPLAWIIFRTVRVLGIRVVSRLQQYRAVDSARW
jgi:hypothetical protein